jgi:hypothetical protein
MTTTTTETTNINHARIISTPRKSSYQFFVKEDFRSPVALAIRELFPHTVGKTSDPKKELIYKRNHSYVGWLGFNLPGDFEARKKVAGMLFKNGWKWRLAVELPSGGLRALTNFRDKTGTPTRENHGPCAGCSNNSYATCLGCVENFYYDADGKKQAKPAYSEHTKNR